MVKTILVLYSLFFRILIYGFGLHPYFDERGFKIKQKYHVVWPYPLPKVHVKKEVYHL